MWGGVGAGVFTDRLFFRFGVNYFESIERIVMMALKFQPRGTTETRQLLQLYDRIKEAHKRK